MDIIVNDTNILIDLQSVGLLEEVCKLPCEVHTVDFVIGEITDSEQQRAIALLIEDKKIHVHSFSPEDVTFVIMEHMSAPGNLSIPDIAVCYYAKNGSYKLITGDRQLRNYAMGKNLEVHGILYIFDELVRNCIITPAMGAAKLIELRAVNVRLPKSEIEARIKKWIK